MALWTDNESDASAAITPVKDETCLSRQGKQSRYGYPASRYQNDDDRCPAQLITLLTRQDERRQRLASKAGWAG